MSIRQFKVNSKDVSIANATILSPGFMSAEDKLALEAMKSQAFDGSISEITVHVEDLEDITDRLDVLDSSVNGIERLDEVQNSSINSLETQVKSAQSDITDINSSISSLKSKDTEIDASITALKNKDSEIDSSIGELKAKDIEHDSSLSALDTSVINHEKRITDLESIHDYWCGRVWDESSMSPEAKTYVGNLEMLKNIQEVLGLGCYLVENDHTRRKLDPKDHYKFLDGTEAKLDGSMGHYQWGWDKEFYISFWNEGNLFYECISLVPIRGKYNYKIPVATMSATGRAAIDRETQTLVSYINMDPRYRGGNNRAEWDEDPNRCLLGMPGTSYKVSQFKAAARKNGEGWYCGLMRMNTVLKVLFEIVFGTRNEQAKVNPELDINGLRQGGLGSGLTNLNSTYWSQQLAYNPICTLDKGVELGDGCGETEPIIVTNWEEPEITYNAGTVPVFFGLKNMFGQIWLLTEDEASQQIEVYDANVSTSIGGQSIHWFRPSMLENDYPNYDQLNVDNVSTYMIQGSTSMNVPGGYVKTMSYKNLENWPLALGGSGTTGHCDYWYSYATSLGLRLVGRGGYAHHGAGAGLGYSGVYVGVTWAGANGGSFLCEFEGDWKIEPIFVL